MAYYEKRSEIKEFLNLQKRQEAEARAEAKQAGLLQTCSCCIDEVMPKDIYRCENGECAVLPPQMFSKVALKKQLEEVTAAGIEDLETCPFCDFTTIPAKEDRLFRCFNPECMKESCRLCKEPSHVPLRCDEVEKDDDVKNRSDTNKLHQEAVLKGAEEAKQEIGVTDSQLKIDPTADIQQHLQADGEAESPPAPHSSPKSPKTC